MPEPVLQPGGAGRGWRPVGDAAWLLEAGAGLDLAMNARMRVTAAAVTREAVEGVRDVVPAATSVTVHVDPLRFSGADAARFPLLSPGTAVPAGRLHEVPVVYDGEDLDAVAASSGLSSAEVRQRHAASEFTVLMLGFAPGFPYLAPLDPRLAVRRLSTPRVHVPSGAVAVAGGMTCIYPGGTAGGWRILGRTNLTLFQPGAAAPATLAPGDRVRFVPVDRLDRADIVPADSAAPPPVRAGGLRVLRAGGSTTVQDGGRWGFQALGVPVSGACDGGALRLANQVVGNPDGAAGLEVALVGPDLRAEEDAVVAYAGASMDVQVDGRPMAPGMPTMVRAGAVIRCGQVHGGLRAYLAVAGGLDVPVVLGSRSTCLTGGFGGFAGRPLLPGDRVDIGSPAGAVSAGAASSWPRRSGTGTGKHLRLRVLPGPHVDAGGEALLEHLLSDAFRVSPQLNRVACRLHGDPARVPVSFEEMQPAGTVPGAVQVTPSGDLLLLLADRQTTGGYPQVLSVIGADQGAAAQLCPGDTVRFERCSLAEARSALGAVEARA